jgi:type VI protein secretion system component VasF
MPPDAPSSSAPGPDDIAELAAELRRLRELERIAPGSTRTLREPSGAARGAARPRTERARVVPVWLVMAAVLVVFVLVALIGVGVTGVRP